MTSPVYPWNKNRVAVGSSSLCPKCFLHRGASFGYEELSESNVFEGSLLVK